MCFTGCNGSHLDLTFWNWTVRTGSSELSNDILCAADIMGIKGLLVAFPTHRTHWLCGRDSVGLQTRESCPWPWHWGYFKRCFLYNTSLTEPVEWDRFTAHDSQKQSRGGWTTGDSDEAAISANWAALCCIVQGHVIPGKHIINRIIYSTA
jgi:hypothetical protein